MLYSAMCACQIRRFSMLFYSRARKSTCKFAWHQSVFLPPLVLSAWVDKSIDFHLRQICLTNGSFFVAITA